MSAALRWSAARRYADRNISHAAQPGQAAATGRLATDRRVFGASSSVVGGRRMVLLFLLCAVVVGIFLSCQRQVFLPSVVVELLSAEEQAHQS